MPTRLPGILFHLIEDVTKKGRWFFEPQADNIEIAAYKCTEDSVKLTITLTIPKARLITKPGGEEFDEAQLKDLGHLPFVDDTNRIKAVPTFTFEMVPRGAQEIDGQALLFNTSIKSDEGKIGGGAGG